MRGQAAAQRRPFAVLTLALVGLAAAAGCGDSDDDGGQDFAASELRGLSLGARELPRMEYQSDSSGPDAFVADQREEAREEGDQSGLRVVERLRELGLEADYVSQFFAFSRQSELGFAESIAFLFEDEDGAEQAIREVQTASARNIAPADEIAPANVGEQGFGLRGEFEGFPTFTFGWRFGDVIQLLTTAPNDPETGLPTTRALAERLAAKAEEE